MLASFAFVLLLRFGGFQGDFGVYLAELSSGWHSFYYLREPLFWVGAKLMYSVFGSELFVILIYDAVFCLSLFFAVKKAGAPHLFWVFLISFPVFLGLENVYRQVLGLPFLFLFLNYAYDRSFFKALGFLVIAGLFHNAYFMFSPFAILAISWLSLGVRNVLVLIFLVGITLLIYIAEDLYAYLGKSTAQQTGLDLRYAYLFFIAAVWVWLAYIRKMYLLNEFIVGFLFLYYYCIISVYLGSAQAERVGMIVLVSLFYIAIKMSYSKGRQLGATYTVSAVFALGVPVFLFPSTISFLVP